MAIGIFLQIAWPLFAVVSNGISKTQNYAFTGMISLHHDYVNSHPNSWCFLMIIIISASFSLISVPQNQYIENILISSPNCSSKSHLPGVIIGNQLKTFSRNPSKLPYICCFFFISSKWVAFHDPCLPSSTWLKVNRKTSRFPPLTTAASPAISAANSALNIFCCGGPVGNFGCSWRQVSNFFVASKEVWHRNRASLYPGV